MPAGGKSRAKAGEPPMKSKPFNEPRVEETAKFIAKELMRIIDRNTVNSVLSKLILEECPTYENMSNGDRFLATLRALSIVQIEVTKDISTMLYGKDSDEEEAEAA
jgi:hypothetical protein